MDGCVPGFIRTYMSFLRIFSTKLSNFNFRYTEYILNYCRYCLLQHWDIKIYYYPRNITIHRVEINLISNTVKQLQKFYFNGKISQSMVCLEFVICSHRMVESNGVGSGVHDDMHGQ